MRVQVIIKKLCRTLVTALLVALLCFSVMFYSPGNPAEKLLRYKDPTGGLNPKTVEMYAEKLGTNGNFFEQFGAWLAGILKGDFGTSFKTGLPVLHEFTTRAGCTMSLMLLSTLLALVVGLSLGILSTRYHNTILDKVIRFFAVFNTSVPSFWLALLFLWIFSIRLHLLPSFGFNGFSSLILPVTVLGLSYSSTIIRITKSCLMDNLSSAYVVTARAKGLSESSIMIRHVLINIALPIITLCGTNMASLLGGSVIIENIYGLPGLGNYLVMAIMVKDFPVILGFVFIFALFIMLINLLVDLTYTLIDPRVRMAMNEKQ
ncbi:ABC transporter permease [Methanosarcina sp. DH1]|uniref:ABC transporter permease n=1 Tax=Methanosarcina sp. DH1 TaxID=2605695 RepID=UPI001E611ADD|nr:ABC transporter permease [Methanosarcina sp. DH1]